MLKIAVCDDEREIRSSIRRNILLLYPDTEIIEFGNGQELAEAAEEFDIIFLDIRMEGLDGMQTAKLLRRRRCKAEIIFITALEQYVFEAFDVGAFHYLVKPFDKTKFYAVLQKAVEGLSCQKTEKAEEEAFVLLRQGAETKKVYLSDIFYLEVLNRKITLYGQNGKEEFYGRLGEMEKRLGSGFMRVHRSYLVHFKYVASYNASEITLEDGSRVPLAKQKYREFVNNYMEYVKRKQGMS